MEYIVYEDKQIIVCRKPSGLAVQNASFGKKDLESMMKTYLFEKEGRANPYLGVIHRLDQPVQGLVVFARDAKSAASLSAQVQNGQMKKYYQAVSCKIPEEKEGMLIHFLKKNGKTNCSEAVSERNTGAKKAQLYYKVLEEKEGCALFEIELFTGRHHQIRCQLSGIGCVIKGDLKYGAPRSNPDGGICLHSHEIRFIHPVRKEEMDIIAPPPASWKGLDKLR